MSGGKRSKCGMPQGGVMLANIYLNLFDQMFLSYCRLTGLAAELIRCADDFVILMRGGAEKTLVVMKQMLERMGLKLNEKKSRLMEIRAILS